MLGLLLAVLLPSCSCFVLDAPFPRRSVRMRMAVETDAISRVDLLRNLAVPLSGAAAFRAGAAIAVIGQPRVPPLTGKYDCVGVRVVRIGEDGCRAKVFYPAIKGSGADAPYCTDGRATSDSMAGLVGFRQLGLSFLLAHLATASSGAELDATPVADASLPLLVYSHGFGGNMDMGTYLMRQMSSYGAIVVALDHTDGTASCTRLADGSLLKFSPRLLSNSAQLERRAKELLAATQADALPADLPIDRERVFLGGHSYGGPACLVAAAASGDATMDAASIRGLVLHDPALSMGSNLLQLTRDCPTMSIVSDEYDAAGVPTLNPNPNDNIPDPINLNPKPRNPQPSKTPRPQDPKPKTGKQGCGAGERSMRKAASMATLSTPHSGPRAG
jgi:predicted esterase